MTAKLYKAADVCDLAQLQPYVLRSWEKEFPGIGVQNTPDGPRLYRQTDVDQVLRIKQLVFGEGLTLAGARRRLEADPHTAPHPPAPQPPPVVREQAPSASRPDPELRTRIATVRQGLQGILDLLSTPQSANGHASAPAGDYQLVAPPEPVRPSNVSPMTERRAPAGKSATAPKRKRASA